MSTPLLFAFPGNETLAACLAAGLDAELGEFEVRRFPDGESYVRFDSDVTGRPVILLATLVRPDEKVMALLFAAMAARDEGAHSVGLVAPYLSYMRQDRQFRPGEAITSCHFAKILSGAVDWLVTVDPHLHRHSSLSDIYTIPTTAASSAPLLAAWIGDNVKNPFLLGPDEESRQWVAEVARGSGDAPFSVFSKVRHGDRDVVITLPDSIDLSGRTPVLVDDIISTAGTMAEAARLITRQGGRAPVCVAVHGVFAGKAEELLMDAGVARVVTTNTIAHATNAIDITGLLARSTRSMLAP
ncbi:MAG: ribose-phosphate diphosphokinase [Alphaproteobacteria bacterium]|nr:MAG: ribose-phosphate diphosphokinase [Alphaproteobacteria bacterium]